MKKKVKSEVPVVPQEESPDIAGLIIKVQQQLSFLEKKIDTLIAGQGQASQKTFERKEQPKHFQRFDHSNHPRDSRQDSHYRERMLHKAICADCHKECEVPFKPSQDRPVYCKDCFSKRKGPSSFGERPDNKFRGEAARSHGSHTSHFDRPHGGEKKKFFEKKRPSARKRKARG